MDWRMTRRPEGNPNFQVPSSKPVPVSTRMTGAGTFQDPGKFQRQSSECLLGPVWSLELENWDFLPAVLSFSNPCTTMPLILEGRRIASGASRGRKVRTPEGAMPRNPGRKDRDTRGRKAERLFDGQCHRKQTAAEAVCAAARVKRRGKSPPPGE